MLSTTITDNEINQEFVNYVVERRDEIIKLGLFCHREGLPLLREQYHQGELKKHQSLETAALEQRCQVLQNRVDELVSSVKRLGEEKTLIRQETVADLEAQFQTTYEKRLQLASETEGVLRNQLQKVREGLEEEKTRLRQECQQAGKLERACLEQKLHHQKESHQLALDNVHALHQQQTTMLQERLLEREQEIERWNFSGTGKSGNVAKGNLGEKILKNLLELNLPKVLGVECSVSDVSKGKGGNADLLIEIPSRGVNLLIESKYKSSEKVRTKEIDRMRKDLVENDHEANIILGVSFDSSFTGYHNRHVEFTNSVNSVKVLSLIEHFNKMAELDNGAGLCSWIDFLSRVYSNIRHLVGTSDRAILVGLIDDLQQAITLTNNIERQTLDRLTRDQQDLADIRTLGLSMLPQILHKLQLGLHSHQVETPPDKKSSKGEIYQWLLAKGVEVDQKLSKKLLLEKLNQL